MPTDRNDNRIPTKISPDVLDQIGRDFKFNHAKGIAEWLKNSLDAYLVRRHNGDERSSGLWPVHLHLINGLGRRSGPNLAVMDFCGTTYADVEGFLLNWFDTSAAQRGSRADLASLTGGHGNGGKFYMREMWERGARFCTWLDGNVTSLIVDHASDGTCGYWEYQNEPCSWHRALEVAYADVGLSSYDIEEFAGSIDPHLINELDNGFRGFSVVAGLSGKQIWTANDVVSVKRWKPEKLIEAVRDAPAAHRPLREIMIRVAVDGKLVLPHLRPGEVDEDPAWPMRECQMPVALTHPDGGSNRIRFDVGGAVQGGLLTIRKAVSPLTGRRRLLNQITVFDPGGNPVGSFPITDLAAGSADHTAFLFGDLAVDFKEIEQFVENDRESFRRTPQVEAIRLWIRDQLSMLVDDMENEAHAIERERNLEKAVHLNQLLNDYARKFLQQLESEVFIDWLDEPGGGEGGMGIDDGSRGGTGGQGGGNEDDSGGRKDEPGTEQRVRRSRFPRILLSGHDGDPASPSHTRELTAGHPPIYQNEQDQRYNVWWINTSHPYAREAFAKGVSSNAWKEYHLFMFRDVVQIEHLRLLQRRDADMELDLLENELIRRSGDFLASLTRELAEEVLQ